MKTKSLIIAGILGAAISSQAAVILQENFDANTITGVDLTAGNTLSTAGWDVDLTGSVGINVFTSVGSQGFTTSTLRNFSTDTADRAKGFSFTFTTNDTYDLTSISTVVNLKNTVGANKGAAGTTAFTIVGSGVNYDSGNVAFASSTGSITVAASLIGTTLASGELYTVTVLTDNVFEEQYNLFTLEGTAVPEPSSFALLGGLLALGHVMVRRRR